MFLFFLRLFSLRNFERAVIRQVHQGFDGRAKDADNDWNYFGAVLYAVTLISTIGKNFKMFERDFTRHWSLFVVETFPLIMKR